VKRWVHRAIFVVVCLLIAGAGWKGYRSFYADERDALIEETKGFRFTANAYEKELEKQRALRDRLALVASTTLGKQFPRTEHRLRTGLSRVGLDAGLSDVVVSSSAPEDQKSPAVFSVVKAQVKGTGTLAQVLQALAMYEAQPWIHRVQSMSIQPVGRERDQFELKLDVSTVWMPDLAVDDPNDPSVVSPDEAGVAAIAAIAGKNIFRVPPAPAPEKAVAQAPQPERPRADPAPAWGDWKLTGVVSGRRGLEALLLNTRSGDRLALVPGGVVLGATLVSGGGEEAVFELEGAKWRVRTGATLADRVRQE
jgi:Tfp pilus assembly protein PilO